MKRDIITILVMGALACAILLVGLAVAYSIGGAR